MENNVLQIKIISIHPNRKWAANAARKIDIEYRNWKITIIYDVKIPHDSNLRYIMIGNIDDSVWNLLLHLPDTFWYYTLHFDLNQKTQFNS